MTYKDLAEEFCQMHILCAKKMAGSALSRPAQGERNVLFFLLSVDKEILAGQIARKLNLSASRVTNILNSLVKKGLVQKRIDPTDKRHVYVSMTEEGKKYVCQKYREVISMYENVFRKLGMEDSVNYIRIVKRLSVLFDEERTKKQPS
ncbi:MAG: MarR family winged helix-turn-helix transcriptional regulator [Ruminococcus sp.]|jgi:DNA-binding MarR family transcriptional regulator